MPSLLLALLLAVQTPTPTPTPAPTGQLPRLALVVGKAVRPVMQPSFERFANDTATRFANQFSVVAVPMPGNDRPQYANPALCKSLDVVGFLVPGRRWHLDPKAVSVTSYLVIFDCEGDFFFDDEEDFSEPRNEAMLPQAQIDSAGSHATDLVLAKFAAFVSGHQVLWSRFLTTGSIREVSPSPSPS
jgi:hypothetical protein